MFHLKNEILTLLKEDITIEQIVDILDEKYENERSTLVNYVKRVIDGLRSANLIIE